MAGRGQGSTNANHQKILLHLLNSVDENKYCCDCDAKGPRWASWNLGLFICIRCAGIHRNLGVHISKVKSVNLDSWTSEQISSVINMGNKKAREIYEAQLPSGHRRPQEDYALEQFIRNKYDKKMYADSKLLKELNFEKIDIEKYLAKINGTRTRPAARGTGQISAPPSSNTRPQSAEASKQQTKEATNTAHASNKNNTTSSTTAPQAAPQPVANVDELLSFGTTNTPSTPVSAAGTADKGRAPNQNGNDASLTTQAVTSVTVSSASQGNSLSSDLAGLVFESAPQTNSGGGGVSGNDLFGNSAGDMFGSPPFNNDTTTVTTTNTDDKSKSSGKKSNQDILSLYGSSNTTSAFNPNIGTALTGGGMNMNNIHVSSSPFAAPPPTCGPVAAPSSYQWNQPINSHSPLQMQSRTGVVGGGQGVDMNSPFQQSNSFTATSSNSSNMYLQNNLASQFGNLSFGSSPAVAATMANSNGHHQGTNNFASMANGNPFAGAQMVNSTSAFGSSSSSQTANSNPYSSQQMNWQQPITSSYNYNNFTSNQNSMPPMYNNTAPLNSQNKMFAPTMQNQQQNQFAQNFNQFQGSPFAGNNVTNQQQQFNSQMMSSSMFASANAQPSPAFGGYSHVQNQQQSLWLN